MSEALAARLDRIEARTAIADLVHGYARAVRSEAYEAIAALFVPEGTFEVRSGRPDGADSTLRQRFDSPAALVAFLLQGKGGPHPVPLIHNLMVTVDGETAQAEALMTATITGTDRTVAGAYQDSFERRDGRWLFRARVYTVFG
ncbi:nuclear transport factor 2 family protein [Novosphingobium soli]|uniref:Nuclear transport factor 2 family protein n=1 Tax=Novosphingobium soli TaxID=574956 RepID=A0ABV6D0L4_9SPHN